MSLKDIKEAQKERKVLFGIKQVLKAAKVPAKKTRKKSLKVFVAEDARDETLKKLKDAGVEFKVLKTKSEISKEIGLNFESEVFSIK